MAHAALEPAPAGAGERKKLAEIGMGAAWITGLFAAISIADALLGKTPLAAALAGAVLSDLGAGFAGVRWDSLGAAAAKGDKKKSDQKASTFYAIGFGSIASFFILALTLGISAVFGWISADAGTPSAALLLALVRAAALAVRDELCFRGIPFATAARAGLPPWMALVFGSLAGCASMTFASAFNPAAMVLSVASGLFFGALWLRFRCAWAAVSAHAAFLFLIGPGMRGGLLDVAWSNGALAPQHRSYGGGAFLCALVFALAAAALLRFSLPVPLKPSHAPKQSK